MEIVGILVASVLAVIGFGIISFGVLGGDRDYLWALGFFIAAFILGGLSGASLRRKSRDWRP